MLFRPSSQIQVPKTMIIVKDIGNIAQSSAFMASSWLTLESGKPFFTKGPSGSRSYNNEGYVEADYWTFDGNFQRASTIIPIDRLPSDDSLFEINKLTVYPMIYAEENVQNAIRARGEMFWKCRRQNYVCYSDRSMDGTQNSVRTMFFRLHIKLRS